jgi:hypothetical protein
MAVRAVRLYGSNHTSSTALMQPSFSGLLVTAVGDPGGGRGLLSG